MRHRRRADEDDEEFDRPAAARPWWWRLFLRRPRDTLAFVVASAAAVAIIVNGAYLQHGRHPAPIFSVHPLPVAAARDTVGSLHRPRTTDLAARHEPVELPRARPTTAPPVVTTRKDAIADLLAANPPPARGQTAPAHAAEVPASQQATQTAAPAAAPVRAPSRSLAQPSRQVLAVQRALSDFGFAQLKPTGIYDAETQAAVQHFERERHLPVTADISDAVKRELAKLVGHDLD